jgi:hypothetical protein
MSIELNVPFKDNKAARSLGATWNREKKVWYVSSLDDLTPFRRWLPTGAPLMRIFLQAQEDKRAMEIADKAAAFAFEKTKGEAANIFVIANHMGLSYNEADAVCSFIYMHAWRNGENDICGMHIVRKYAISKGVSVDEMIKELKKLRVPYDYGCGLR